MLSRQRLIEHRKVIEPIQSRVWKVLTTPIARSGPVVQRQLEDTLEILDRLNEATRELMEDLNAEAEVRTDENGNRVEPVMDRIATALEAIAVSQERSALAVDPRGGLLRVDDGR